MGGHRISLQAGVIADRCLRWFAESSEPLGQFKIILRSEDSLHVDIELQPSLIQHLLHQIQIRRAIILRNGVGIVLQNPRILGILNP